LDIAVFDQRNNDVGFVLCTVFSSKILNWIWGDFSEANSFRKNVVLSISDSYNTNIIEWDCDMVFIRDSQDWRSQSTR